MPSPEEVMETLFPQCHRLARQILAAETQRPGLAFLVVLYFATIATQAPGPAGFATIAEVGRLLSGADTVTEHAKGVPDGTVR